MTYILAAYIRVLISTLLIAITTLRIIIKIRLRELLRGVALYWDSMNNYDYH